MLGIDYVSSDEEDTAPVATQAEVSPVNRQEKGAIATNIELPISSLPVAAPIPKPSLHPIDSFRTPAHGHGPFIRVGFQYVHVIHRSLS